MSAGFKFGGEVFWGTNGAVEAYLEALAQQASTQLGDEDPITAFFRFEHEHFFTGAVTRLDKILLNPTSCERFLPVLDGATEKLLETNAFSEYGKSWIKAVIANLRGRISTFQGA